MQVDWEDNWQQVSPVCTKWHFVKLLEEKRNNKVILGTGV